MPPVITTSTRLACASAWATSSELVTTVRPGTLASLRASSWVVVPAPTTTASPSSTRPAARSAMALFSAAERWVFCG